MSDKLLFDLSQELDGSPNVFVKKDWLNILDNQNGNYGSNQSVVDTSSLSNSNKYLSYKEAYLSVPLLLTLTSPALTFAPATEGTSCDYTLGLKNWFGSIIHSFTMDFNGTTIIQQTAYVNMWNSFKLMTSFSWNDVITQGSTIGFFPDDPLTWSYESVASVNGIGVCNNTNAAAAASGGLSTVVSAVFTKFKSTNGNEGLLARQNYINYDPDGDSGNGNYSGLLTATNASNIWKSYVSNKVNTTAGPINGAYQLSVRATIYLKHIHSFFQNIPLLKGVYMKLTLNLNNSSVVFTSAGAGGVITLTDSTVPVGGVQPLMIASAAATNGSATPFVAGTYTASLSVGATCLNNSQRSLANVQTGNVGSNIFLYVSALTFNPIFEQAYLSSPLKTIEYTDIYQYQVSNINAGGNINALITNGIANVKSVLCLPFFSSIVPGGAGVSALPVWQSPFDPAGTGPTSPLCHLTNFNIVVSGQNAIYNTERYLLEQFNNQLYGVNAVNGGLTDGLTSSLINSQAFEMEYCYYYVNVGRMLDVEQSVPKSIQVIGQNVSALPIVLICFVEYGVNFQVDVLTGAKV